MHQVKNGSQLYFGFKAHISVESDTGQVLTVSHSAINVHYINQATELLHCNEITVRADFANLRIKWRPGAKGMLVNWKIAMMRGKARYIDRRKPNWASIDALMQTKASKRAKADDKFQIIKCQFSYTKNRNLGLVMNTAQIIMHFALPNLWMDRRHLMGVTG